MPLIYTIGHSTRSAEELIALLRAFDVQRVVDVRRYPGSRRHPHFSGERLARTLRDAGIEYEHAEVLGGRRPVHDDSPNDAWRNRSFRGYADHMRTGEFQQGVERLRQLAQSNVVAMLCAEAVPWRCHRNLIADALTTRGVEVRHILSEGRADVHKLHADAHVKPDGMLVYSRGARQIELLE